MSYEIFLRSHQLLTAGIWVALWYHISGANSVVKWYVLGVAIGSGVITTAHGLHILIRHRLFYHGSPRVLVRGTGTSASLHIYSPVKIRYQAGQYINLYMPTMGVRSFFETHPFIVIAVTDEGAGQCSRVMVKAARGWSRRLLEHAELSVSRELSSSVAFFSGPHGRPISVNEYGTVILVASQWGIMAQLPYLKHLVGSSYNRCTKVQRACLLWQLDHLGRF